MKEIFDVLIQYWKPIVGLIFTIIGFIIALIKKKPVTDIFKDIYDACILAVTDTEVYSMVDPNCKGDEKLNMAVKYVMSFLITKYPTLKDVYRYEKIIKETIEKLLSTPQKKS